MPLTRKFLVSKWWVFVHSGRYYLPSRCLTLLSPGPIKPRALSDGLAEVCLDPTLHRGGTVNNNIPCSACVAKWHLA